MYKVTVDGETKVWGTLEVAMTDLFTRGYDHDEWTLERVAP